MLNDVVVTGVGLETPIGRSLNEVAAALFAGDRSFKKGAPAALRSAHSLPDFPVSMLDVRRSLVDQVPLSQLLLDLSVGTVRTALEMAGLFDPKTYRNGGVFLGTSHGSNVGYVDYLTHVSDNSFCLYSPSFVTKSLIGEFGLEGPSETVNTACSSTLVAANSAVECLRDGELDIAILCGVDLFSLVSYAGFSSLNAMDPEGTRPFSEQRQGLTLGDGVASFVLEKRASADARGVRPMCTIISTGMRNETYHPTRPDPQATVTSELQRSVLGDLPSHASPYFLAHGTGTSANDSTELLAIETACDDRREKIPVTAVKYHFGHTLGSAGAMQLVSALCAIMRNSLIPNGVRSETIGTEKCYFPSVPEPLDGRTIIMNSFGFGGSLASAAVR